MRTALDQSRPLREGVGGEERGCGAEGRGAGRKQALFKDQAQRMGVEGQVGW